MIAYRWPRQRCREASPVQALGRVDVAAADVVLDVGDRRQERGAEA
jgi:hypothetical protein